MFLRFFRSSFPIQYISIGILAILLWVRAFFQPPGMPVPEGPVPFYRLTYSLLCDLPMIASLLGFLITLTSAFLLNALLTRHEIVPKNSSLTALLYVALMSYLPFLLTLHPVSISAFFLILVLDRLYRSYNKSGSMERTFVAGFLIGLAALFYLPFLFFYILLLISLILFRNNDPHEWIGSFIGLATPFIFLSVWYFWNDVWTLRYLEYLKSFKIAFDPSPLRMNSHISQNVLVVAAVLFGIHTGLNRLSEKTIEIRKKTILLIWIIPVMLLAAPFAASLLKYHLLLSFLTVAGLMSGYLLKLKKSFWQEILLIGILVSVILANLISGLI